MRGVVVLPPAKNTARRFTTPGGRKMIFFYFLEKTLQATQSGFERLVSVTL